MAEKKKLERLDKILANNGFGTRKEVRHIVSKGFVKVNGIPVKEFDLHVDPENDEIAVGEKYLLHKKNTYFMMNKKAGCVCSAKSDSHETVFDYMSEEDRQKKIGGSLAIVGRLDVDTEGLLLFTTDGDLNHKLTFPKYEVKKTYLVHLRCKVSDGDKAEYIRKAKSGIHIPACSNDEECDAKPCLIEFLEDDKCTITVTEGRFHEVKRIFIALENEVVYLKRLSMGNLVLDKNLASGEYRPLTKEEIESLKTIVSN